MLSGRRRFRHYCAGPASCTGIVIYRHRGGGCAAKREHCDHGRDVVTEPSRLADCPNQLKFFTVNNAQILKCHAAASYSP
jgi:hypothetical protein